MKIRSLGAAFPHRKVTNDDVVDEIARRTSGHCGDLSKTLTYVRRTLRKSGSGTRCWCAENESSLDLTANACRQAMSSLKEGDTIDLIIYASVYGEVGEPASSNVIAHELGLDLTECVDMKAACDGAMKAFKHASALLAAGLYERIMVVNAEFSLRQDYAIWPKLFDLKSPDQLNYRFPAYTIGEAASAVIVEHNPATPWRFHNATRNNLFDLCTVAPAWYKKGSLRSPRVGMDGAGMFTSWAAELSANGIPLSVETFRQSGIKPDEVDILFTHASGTRDWTEITKQIDLFDKWYDIYPEYGNLVSASVPVAMALASAQGRLEREMRVAILVASAGMTFSTAHFTF